MMKRRFFVLLTVFAAMTAAANERFELNGSWNLVSSDGMQTTAEVPGSVMEALTEANLMPDPYYGVNGNDERVRAVLYQDWTFSKTFTLPASFSKENGTIELVFDSVDTTADIFLNGEKIGHTENMFRQYRFPIDFALLKEENTVSVKIFSPVNTAAAAAEKYGSSLMTTFAAGMVDGIPYIRKSWFSYGWDWGIALPDSGLNLPVAVELIEGARLAAVPLTTEIRFDESGVSPEALSAAVSCIPEIDGSADGLTFRLTLSGHGVSRTAQAAAGEEVRLEIASPKLWYTHDLGGQNRYRAQAELLKDGRVIDSETFSIGLRELKLINRKDLYGESFYFTLNRIPLFARGGNWIPCDTMIPRGVKSGLIEKRLQDCLDMNFNMIRIWGGGIYEDDRFYEFCDANGILVWQDFPFACYATPHLEEFYENVSAEVEDQLRRLVNRPSLAILCGNNEIEKGWKEWGFALFFPKHKPGYRYLFEELLPELTARYAPQIPYWPSSPSAGGNFRKTVNPRYGDSHNWLVWHGGLDYTAYRRYPARFMSEFGFQSFPDMKTVRQFTPPGEESFDSPTMKVHQKNPAGNGLILSYMRREFNDPGEFPKQVVLSQLTQALAMECGIDYWRAHRTNEQCMGALYWQINDTWPNASWSAVDYFGRKKALYYYSKRFYAPVISVAYRDPEDGMIRLFVTSDLRRKCRATVVATVCDFDGTPLKRFEFSASLKPGESRCVKTFRPADFEAFDPEESFMELVTTTECAEETVPVHENSFFFEVFKRCAFRHASVGVEVRNGEAGTFEVVLSTDKPAFFVTLDTPGVPGIFSDNSLTLLPGEPKTLLFCPKGKTSVAALRKAISVNYLRKTYN